MDGSMQSNESPRYTRPSTGGWLIRLAVVVTILRVWLGPEPWDPRAEAAIPDSGLQRKLILEEVQRANDTLARIEGLLKSGTFDVRVVEDKSAGKGG